MRVIQGVLKLGLNFLRFALCLLSSLLILILKKGFINFFKTLKSSHTIVKCNVNRHNHPWSVDAWASTLALFKVNILEAGTN